MYTVSKGQGPSKLVAKSRRGLAQNYEKFESIKEGNKRNDANSLKECSVPRPIFQSSKKSSNQIKSNNSNYEVEALSPEHEEMVEYINESWNLLFSQNCYYNNNNNNANNRNNDNSSPANSKENSGRNVLNSTTSRASSMYCIEPPSPLLTNFKPFDLESWWGRRLYNNITKSL